MSLFGALNDFGVPPCTDPAEQRARLKLSRTPRVGAVSFASLLNRFGSAIKALDALPSIGRRAGGVTLTPPSDALIDAELAKGAAAGAQLIVLGEAAYPSLLARIDAAPPILWVIGDAKLFTPRALAIVGARNASAAGQKMASILSRELAEAGFIVVSGMARGIDARAHEAALTTGTIAVLGGGVDDIYPQENTPLYQALREQGLIVSESPPGYRAQARDFPRRNRLISGLSYGVIVVEAELKSGSLITARLAAEQNREVFAVPGSPLDPRAKGTNDLLRNGATLCENAADVINAIEPLMGLKEAASLRPWSIATGHVPLRPVSDEAGIDALRGRLLGLISFTPIERSELLRALSAPTPDALAALSELEITGQINCPDGFNYVRA
jgi:DNA processing protein